MPDFAFQAVLGEFFAQDGVALAEGFQPVAGDGAGAADTQAGARERLAEHHVVGQAQLLADDADFVLEEQFDGLDELELQVFGQAANVVVGFDGARFDDVGINGTLGQETDAVQFARFLLEDADELGADDLPLLLGIGYAGEFVEEAVGGIHIDEVGVQLVAEHAHDLLGFAFAQESVIDMDGNQLFADGFDQQGRDDGGIDTAGERQQYFPVADLRAQFLNLFVNESLGQFGCRDPLHGRGTDVTSCHIVQS